MRTTLHHALLAALVSLLFAPPAVAQLAQLAELAKTTPEQRAEFQTHFMNRKLDLSSEQLESIKKINLAMATDAQPILEGDGSMFGKAIKIRKIQATRERKLKALLSKEQFQRFEDAKGELQSAMRERFGSTAASGDP